MFEAENYYQILNIPFSYSIDPEVVEKHYIRLYKAITQKTNEMLKDKEFTDNYLAMLNDAKKCLSDDLLRAEHYLYVKNRIPSLNQSDDFLKIIFDLRSIESPEARAIELKKTIDLYKDKMEKALANDELDEACDNLSKIKFLTKHYE